MRRVFHGLLSAIVSFSASAAVSSGAHADQYDVVQVDDTYGYYPDDTSYNSSQDVVMTVAVDWDKGPFWLAIQCTSMVGWSRPSKTTAWELKGNVPDDFRALRGALCALRGSLPEKEF